MRNLTLAITLVIGASLLTGCKLDKMIKLAQENDLQVDPNPLEVHGGAVAYEMSAVLPEKMLPSNTSFTLNQIYVYGDEELAVGSTVFKAEDFPNSSTTKTRKTINFSFPYQEGMNPGTLYIQGVATDTRSGKSKTGDRLAVAQGLVMTSSWVKDVAFASYEQPEYTDKEELVPTKIDFYFDQGKSDLRTSLSYDGKSNRDRRNDLSAFIAEKNVTRTVTITGTHSPEGPETINSDLSKDRAEEIEEYYRARMKSYDYKGAADSIDFIIKPVIQDWSAFRGALMAYSGINQEQKQRYTRIIDGSGTFVEKEKEMQKLDTYDKVFEDVYPGLRSAKTEVLTVKPKKTNAEIAVLAKAIVNGQAEVDTLSEGELMFAATLTPSIEEKADIYKVVADEFGIWQAHNDLAATHIEMALSGDMNKLDGAETQLEIAMKKNAGSATVKSNMAAVQILKGSYEEAYATLSDISGGSNEVTSKVNSMKGALEVRMGSYEKAKLNFNSGMESDNMLIDKGLANLLTDNFTQANDALMKVSDKSDAKGLAYYLMAISAAKQGQAENVEKNLKMAVNEDPMFKDKALNDLEFTSYSTAVNNAVK